MDAKLRIGVNGDVVIAPASACMKWNTEPSGKVRLVFTYWGGLEKKLPEELQPTGGDEQTPHLLANDAAHAKKLTAAIKAWLLERHPDLTQKKSKELMRYEGGGKSYWIGTYPEDERTLALEAIFRERVVPWRIAGAHPAIVWACGFGDLRVRITEDEVRFESEDSMPEYAEPAKSFGTLVFDDGLLAAIAIDNMFDNLREPPKNAAALKTLAAKKPAVLKGKKGDEGDAVVAKIEKGTYAVEAGPDVEAKLRWLTLKRV